MTTKEAIQILKQYLDMDSEVKSEYLEAQRMAIKVLEQQPSEDCISREEALKVMCDNCPMYNCVCRCSSYRHIERMASVTPQQKIGKWVYKNDNKLIASDMGYWQCSNCEEGKLLYKDNFCPNCGAYMAESGDKE